jgi:hypothetical protein
MYTFESQITLQYVYEKNYHYQITAIERFKTRDPGMEFRECVVRYSVY